MDCSLPARLLRSLQFLSCRCLRTPLSNPPSGKWCALHALLEWSPQILAVSKLPRACGRYTAGTRRKHMLNSILLIRSRIRVVCQAWTHVRRVVTAAAPTACKTCWLDRAVHMQVDLPVSDGLVLLDIAFTGTDPKHGFLTGTRQTLLETFDGGKKWEPRYIESVDEEGINYRYNSISFSGSEGWIVGKPGDFLSTVLCGITTCMQARNRRTGSGGLEACTSNVFCSS